MSVADELHKLAALRDQGVLDEGEFQTQKARVLAQGPSAPSAAAPGVETGAKRQAPYRVVFLLALALVVGYLGFNSWRADNWQKTEKLAPDLALMIDVMKDLQANRAPTVCLYKGALAYRLAEARDAKIGKTIAVQLTQESGLSRSSSAPGPRMIQAIADEVYEGTASPGATRDQYIDRC